MFFRLQVGKISRYSHESNRIILVTVSEYPIDFEKINDTSLYRENGALEVLRLIFDKHVGEVPVQDLNSNRHKGPFQIFYIP